MLQMRFVIVTGGLHRETYSGNPNAHVHILKVPQPLNRGFRPGAQMRSRLARLSGGASGASGATILTIHSLCLRLLRDHLAVLEAYGSNDFSVLI